MTARTRDSDSAVATEPVVASEPAVATEPVVASEPIVTSEPVGAAQSAGLTEPAFMVTDVMSTPVVAVSTATPLGEVLLVMLRLGRRHVIVLDAHERCAGILGDRVLAAAWAADPSALSRVRAWQVLAAMPSVVDAHVTIRDVAALMVRDEVDAVAVVDALDHPIGIVTRSDVVAFMAGTCPGPAIAT